MEEINIRDIISFIYRHFLWIFGITVLFFITGFIVSKFFITKIYESSSLMYISSNKNAVVGEELTYNEYSLNVKLSESYSELCKTKRILDKVIEETGLGISHDELSKKITVNSVHNTEIIQIVAQDKSPDVSSQIANAVAVVFTREIPEIIKMDNVQIIDYAIVPNDPIRPNIFLNTVFAGFLGFTGSFSVFFLIEVLDISIKDRKQLEEILDKPVFGIIPKIPALSDEEKSSEKGEMHLRQLSESFIRLASNIEFLNIDQKIGISLIITSSSVSEGKSLIISNLAIALAQANKKVLLIDADMRRPMVHKLYRLSNAEGTSNCLTSSQSWQSYIQKSNHTLLDIITSGPTPPNPGMLLSSQKMKQIINEAKDIYDYVLIDTPPVLSTSDVFALWSPAIDHLLLVAKYKGTTEPQITRTKEDLERINVNITGAILNQFEYTKLDSYSYNNNYLYNYEYTNK